MICRNLILLLLALAPVLAYGWLDDSNRVPPEKWIDLFEAVAERHEATWRSPPDGGTNDFYDLAQNLDPTQPFAQRSPLVFRQPLAIDLGVHDDPWGVRGKVALSTDTLDPTNIFLAQPYRPQVASNLIWRRGDDLEGYAVPTALTVTPSRASMRILDSYIVSLLPKYIDLDLMRRVANDKTGTMDDERLINAWFAHPTGTNWYWQSPDIDWDTGDEIPGTGNKWRRGGLQYPHELPRLSVSSAWHNAEIEVYQYPISIATNVRSVFGWEVGNENLYRTTAVEVVTNYYTRYGWEVWPTQKTWRVVLGRVTMEVTDSQQWTAGGANWHRYSINPVVTLYPDAMQIDGMSLPPLRLLDGTEAVATNYIRLVPPGGSSSNVWDWESNTFRYDIGLAIHGAGFSGHDGVWEMNVDSDGYQDVSAFTWDNGAAYGEFIAGSVTNPHAQSLIYAVSEVLVDNFPGAEIVTSNGVFVSGTRGVLGASFEVTLEGVGYEIGHEPLPLSAYSYNTPSMWDMTWRDYSQRVAIVRQMQWMTDRTHPIGYSPTRYGWSYAEPTYDTRLDPDASMPILQPYDPERAITHIGGDVFAIYSRMFQRPSYEDSGETNYYWGAGDSEHWEIYWPDKIIYTYSNLTPRLSAHLMIYGGLSRLHDDANPLWEPLYPMTQDVQYVGYNDDGEEDWLTHTFRQDDDPMGPDELYARARWRGEWNGGYDALQTQPLSWMGILPMDVTMQTFQPPREPPIYWLPTRPRTVIDYGVAIQWQFKHGLLDLDDDN